MTTEIRNYSTHSTQSVGSKYTAPKKSIPYVIGGVEIVFPAKAYPSQISMMNSVSKIQLSILKFGLTDLQIFWFSMCEWGIKVTFDWIVLGDSRPKIWEKLPSRKPHRDRKNSGAVVVKFSVAGERITYVYLSVLYLLISSVIAELG